MKNIFALLCFTAACAQAVDDTVLARTSELEEILTSEFSDRLDAVIGSLDLLAVSAILDQVEKSRVHVQLLPRLQKLQATWVCKQGILRRVTLPLAVASTLLAIASAAAYIDQAYEISPRLMIVLFGLGCVGETGAEIWAALGGKLMATQTVGIALLLCAKKNVCVVGESDSPAVEAVLKALGLSAEAMKLYAARVL